MNLQVVIHGKTLFWPDRYGWQEKQRVRGTAGYVVDLDAPMELGTYGEGNKAVDGFCVGQEYKLRPAPEGAVVGEISNPLVLRELREFKRAQTGQTEAREVATKAKAEGIMEPDLPPDLARKAAESGRIMTAAGVFAGTEPAPSLGATPEDRERFGGAAAALASETPQASQAAAESTEPAQAPGDGGAIADDDGDPGDAAPEVMDPDPAPKPTRKPRKTARVHGEDGDEG